LSDPVVGGGKRRRLRGSGYSQERAPAAPVAYSWTGGYIGAQAGYAFGDNTASFTFFSRCVRGIRASGSDQPALGRCDRRAEWG